MLHFFHGRFMTGLLELDGVTSRATPSEPSVTRKVSPAAIARRDRGPYRLRAASSGKANVGRRSHHAASAANKKGRLRAAPKPSCPTKILRLWLLFGRFFAGSGLCRWAALRSVVTGHAFLESANAL